MGWIAAPRSAPFPRRSDVTPERPAVGRERLSERSTARDGRRVRDSQHRLVCRRCGHSEDVGCAIGDQPCLIPARAAGFVVDEAEVVFWGLCPACKPGAIPPDRGAKLAWPADP